MKNYLFVGIGGCIGPIFRYLLSNITIRSDFPVITLITNFIGAILIGCVVGIAAEYPNIDNSVVLFLKTGLCGGFTTFSTFSLETLLLIEENKMLVASSYIFVSIVICLLGVYMGKMITLFICNNLY